MRPDWVWVNVCATLKGKNETMIVCVGRVWVSVYEKDRERERESGIGCSLWLWPTQAGSKQAADSLATCQVNRAPQQRADCLVHSHLMETVTRRVCFTESTAATGGQIQTFIHKNDNHRNISYDVSWLQTWTYSMYLIVHEKIFHRHYVSFTQWWYKGQSVTDQLFIHSCRHFFCHHAHAHILLWQNMLMHQQI